MKLNLKLSINRPSNGGISIRIGDELSGIEFIDANISLEEFAEAVTGLACRPMTAEVRGLEFVGKKRVTENRSIVCPLDTYDKKVLEQWLVDNAQEEGWMVNTYLGRQSSVCRDEDGKIILNYSVTKYVDPEVEEIQK